MTDKDVKATDVEANAGTLSTQNTAPPTPTKTAATPSGAATSTGKPGVYRMANLGYQPRSITCPNCQQKTRTEVSLETDSKTMIAFVALLILFWPLCWLPFVSPSCKAATHVCPLCHTQLGTTPPCSN
ncbi:hypothetical protein FisN_19Hu286 [Fistulifera solaris]|uniref:LITAF domain-containing protein n=1 Tax=Fistulifera solaris TaxID=1519565 RepID=A0A1Z5K055_FISSO|nr:hypothetical protein FisN_19Hu286 [Fistulifera solaris]|eukprot:GAX19700.1 hypothetical protein FisN_19Hu286 [Fistulifera solaris]